MKRVLVVLVMAGSLLLRASTQAPKALSIYFIDVEGGQATLFVTPSGDLLVTHDHSDHAGNAAPTKTSSPAS